MRFWQSPSGFWESSAGVLLRRLMGTLPRESIEMSDDGLTVSRGGKHLVTLRWSEIDSVSAYARGAVFEEVICLSFSTEEVTWQITEDCAGFWELADALPRVLPGSRTDWFEVLVTEQLLNKETQVFRSERG